MADSTPMTDEERAIWQVAYAAAFVAEFERSYALYEEARSKSPFDSAATSISAERAITVAELAVFRLREWREQENEDAGRLLPDLDQYWRAK